MHGHVLEVAAAAVAGILVTALVFSARGARPVLRLRNRIGSARHADEGPYSFEVLMSPALWEALPPPPISPAAGMLISTAPRVPWAQRDQPTLAPPGESLFIPAAPMMPVLPRSSAPAPAPVASVPIAPAPIAPASIAPAPIASAPIAPATVASVPVASVPVADPSPITAPIPVVQPEAAPSPPPEVPAPRPISPPYRLRNLRGEY